MWDSGPFNLNLIWEHFGQENEAECWPRHREREEKIEGGRDGRKRGVVGRSQRWLEEVAAMAAMLELQATMEASMACSDGCPLAGEDSR